MYIPGVTKKVNQSNISRNTPWVEKYKKIRNKCFFKKLTVDALIDDLPAPLQV